jgi:hypothetical protein
MSPEEIWDWQCKMHIWSCWLYEIDASPALDDSGYDWLCRLLASNYAKLPGWFTQRVTMGDLTTGTGSAIAKTLTPEEIAAARWWRDEHIPAMQKEADERRIEIERRASGTTGPAQGRKAGKGSGRKGKGTRARG